MPCSVFYFIFATHRLGWKTKTILNIIELRQKEVSECQRRGRR